tara:strand:+ start:1283 stop:1420 length:138 start_codon:yes stop_codon:yes gene_type:complete
MKTNENSLIPEITINRVKLPTKQLLGNKVISKAMQDELKRIMNNA